MNLRAAFMGASRLVDCDTATPRPIAWSDGYRAGDLLIDEQGDLLEVREEFRRWLTIERPSAWRRAQAVLYTWRHNGRVHLARLAVPLLDAIARAYLAYLVARHNALVHIERRICIATVQICIAAGAAAYRLGFRLAVLRDQLYAIAAILIAKRAARDLSDRGAHRRGMRPRGRGNAPCV